MEKFHHQDNKTWTLLNITAHNVNKNFTTRLGGDEISILVQNPHKTLLKPCSPVNPLMKTAIIDRVHNIAENKHVMNGE